MRNLMGFIIILCIASCYSLFNHHHRAARIIENGKRKFYDIFDAKVQDASNSQQFPWMIMILSPSGPRYKLCGGALINAHTVLTAAHCVIGKNSSEIVIVAGIASIYATPKEYTREIRKPARIIVHESYTKTPSRNDYAILLLDKPIDAMSHIDYICLPDMNDIGGILNGNTACVVSGWGKVNDEANYRRNLKKVDLPIVDINDCKIWYYGLQENNICAGRPGRKLVGEGDDGSPLVCQHPQMPQLSMLVGIYSHTHGVAPGVYMSIAHVKDWIEDELWTNKLHYITGCQR